LDVEIQFLELLFGAYCAQFYSVLHLTAALVLFAGDFVVLVMLLCW
jgi:hypothetical protein